MERNFKSVGIIFFSLYLQERHGKYKQIKDINNIKII